MTVQPWSKGPWNVRENTEWGALAIFDADGECLATLPFRAPDGEPEDIDRFDAQLMATAPTMYNALRAIYGKLDPGMLASPEEIDWACRVALDAMKKANAKEITDAVD